MAAEATHLFTPLHLAVLNDDRDSVYTLVEVARSCSSLLLLTLVRGQSNTARTCTP